VNPRRTGLALAAAGCALLGLPCAAAPHGAVGFSAVGSSGYRGYPLRYARPYYGAYYSGYGDYYSSGVIYAPPLDVGVSFYPPGEVPPPAPASSTPAPAATPAPVAPPASAPLPTGVLDVNGYVHSPFSNATVLVPNVKSGQLIYDPTTGQPFRVR